VLPDSDSGMKRLGPFRSPLFWIGLAITIGTLVLALRGLHWTEVGEAVGDANYGLLALAVVILLAALYVRALRWGVLFYPRRGMRMGNLLGTMNVGYAVNNILPLRVGELARAYVIGEAESVSAVHALSTILVERTLDTITVVAMLTVTLPFIDAPGWARGPAVFVGLGFLGLAVVLATLSAARERAMRLVGWAVRFLPERYRQRTERAVDAAIEGFAVLRQPAVVAEAAAWSVVAWLLSALVMFVVLRALGLELPFTAGVFVMAAVSLGMVVPSSPGYIGVFDAIAIESLQNVFGADRDGAASFALVQHAMIYLVPIVIAAVFLWRERGTWRQVRLWVGGGAPVEEATGPRSE
jgi:uncharacterized protein (TIRG00374 family)